MPTNQPISPGLPTPDIKPPNKLEDLLQKKREREISELVESLDKYPDDSAEIIVSAAYIVSRGDKTMDNGLLVEGVISVAKFRDRLREGLKISDPLVRVTYSIELEGGELKPFAPHTGIMLYPDPSDVEHGEEDTDWGDTISAWRKRREDNVKSGVPDPFTRH